MKPGGISVFEDDISHAISILPDSLAGNELTNTQFKNSETINHALVRR